MGFKTVIINDNGMISLDLNCVKIKVENDMIRIPISDINCMLFMNQKVTLTIPVITKLLEENVAIIICDKYKDPMGIFLPYNTHSKVFKQVNTQVNWKITRKKKLWKLIIEEKIKSEYNALSLIYNLSFETLSKYSKEVLADDSSNREGLAAKYYFKQMFGHEYFRNEICSKNFALNYGYKIIASHISRYIASRGYLTQIGIHHKGESNPFNLTYDFIETFRVIVDIWVKLEFDDNAIFTTFLKQKVINILNATIVVNGSKQRLTNAINMIIDSYFLYLLEETDVIIKYDLKTIQYDEE